MKRRFLTQTPHGTVEPGGPPTQDDAAWHRFQLFVFFGGGTKPPRESGSAPCFFLGGDWEDPTQNGQPVFPIIFAGKLRESAKVVSPRVAPVGAPTAFLEIDACEFAFREVGCISQKQVRERTACAHDPAFPGWAKFDHLLFSHGGHGSSFGIGAE